MSMNLGDWEISLRRHGLGGESDPPLVGCSDTDDISTRVSTANTQNRYADGLAEVQEEEPYEAFDMNSQDPLLVPLLSSIGIETEVCGRRPEEEAVSMVKDEAQDETQDEIKVETGRRRRKAIRKIFKAIPVLITFSVAEAEIESESGESKVSRAAIPSQHQDPPDVKTELENTAVHNPVAAGQEYSESPIGPPAGITHADHVISPAVFERSGLHAELIERDNLPCPRMPDAHIMLQPPLKANTYVPTLRLSNATSTATVWKKCPQPVQPSLFATQEMKVLETQSSESSHEPFSGMSEVVESQAASFQASPLSIVRLPSNTERAEREDQLSMMAVAGSSTTREKTGSPARADFPCQFIDVPEGDAIPPSTLDLLKASPTSTLFRALTSLIYVRDNRLYVSQAFKAKEVIAVIDPVLLCSGRDRSCFLGMAKYVPELAKRPGFPPWGDSNASFINHMSLTISRQEPRGNVLKGVYQYCHLLFKTNEEPNVECHFHSHQIILVALSFIAADAPLSANTPPCNTPTLDVRSKLFRSCSTNIVEPFGTGSRSDINHFSLHAETERYSARKSNRKEVTKRNSSEPGKKELVTELSLLSTESTEPSRDIADALSEDFITEDTCEIDAVTQAEPKRSGVFQKSDRSSHSRKSPPRLEVIADNCKILPQANPDGEALSAEEHPRSLEAAT